MTKDQVFEIVKQSILEVMPDVDPSHISIDKSLRDLGANSIDRMEVTTKSMEGLNVVIPLMSFARVENIQGLVDVLAENCI